MSSPRFYGHRIVKKMWQTSVTFVVFTMLSLKFF